MLLNKPLYLDKPYTIGKYEDLVPKKTKDSNTNTSKDFKFKYNYGLSCWIFLDNVGPNYNNNITLGEVFVGTKRTLNHFGENTSEYKKNTLLDITAWQSGEGFDTEGQCMQLAIIHSYV